MHSISPQHPHPNGAITMNDAITTEILKKTDCQLSSSQLKQCSANTSYSRLSLSDRIQKTKLSKLPVIDEWEQLIPIFEEI